MKNLSKDNIERIEILNKEIKEIEDNLLKLSNPTIIKKFEEKLALLEEEKNQLQEDIKKGNIWEKSF